MKFVIIWKRLKICAEPQTYTSTDIIAPTTLLEKALHKFALHISVQERVCSIVDYYISQRLYNSFVREAPPQRNRVLSRLKNTPSVRSYLIVICYINGNKKNYCHVFVNKHGVDIANWIH